MTEERKTQTQYEKGREHGIEQVLVLLSMSVDGYPRRPSVQTLSILGGLADTTDTIFEQLVRFRERIATELRKSDKEAAA